MKSRIGIIGIAILVAGALLTGGYYAYKGFLADRQAARGYQGQVDRRVISQATGTDGRTVKTYTAEEIEEARKNGKLSQGVQPVGPSQATTANDAAIQRTLQTIQEINKINEMNQRLQEQQQRMQKQK